MMFDCKMKDENVFKFKFKNSTRNSKLELSSNLFIYY